MGKEIRTIAAVWAALLVLLAATVAGTALPLGPWGPAWAYAIALAKAGLIGWVYMHLRRRSGLMRLVAVGSLAWLAILCALIALDLVTR